MDYLHELRSSHSAQSQLIFYNISTSIELLIDPPKLHLDVIIFTETAVHVLASYRIDQSQKTVSFVLVSLASQLLLAYKTVSFFSQPHRIIKVIELFTIPLQNVQKFFSFVAFLLLGIVFHIGCHHNKQTI